MRCRTFRVTSISALIASLIITGCFQPVSPTAPSPETESTIPSSTQSPIPAMIAATETTPRDSPTSALLTDKISGLPAPISTLFQIDHITGERREYAILPATQELDNIDVFDPIYSTLLENRWQPIHLAIPNKTTTEAEQALKTLGVHCNEFKLYQDEQLIGNVSGCDESKASFNRSGTDFVWFLPVESVAEGWLVHRERIVSTATPLDDYVFPGHSINAWDQQEHFWVTPKYVGDDLLVVTDVFADYRELWVERNGQLVYTQVLQGVGDCLGAGLQVWDDEHWGLNTEGDVVIDGELMGRKQDYLEAFGLRVWNEKPVYFVAQESAIKIIYDGQILPFEYDEVVHTCYPVYQEVGVHPGIDVLAQMLWFFARKSDTWYYVELELLE